jgi:hypothetical protein
LITKGVAFAICAGSVIGTFWWFKGVAFGIDGPIAEHKGLLWRKVCIPLNSDSELKTDNWDRAGIFTISKGVRFVQKCSVYFIGYLAVNSCLLIGSACSN